MISIKIDLIDNIPIARNLIVQLLHNNSNDYKFIIDFPDFNNINLGTKILIYMSPEFLEHLEKNTSFKFILNDYSDYEINTLNKFQINQLTKSFYVLVNDNISTFNRKSTIKYITKNNSILKSSKSFEDFVTNIGYDSPKAIHNLIYDIYKSSGYDLDITADLVFKHSIRNSDHFVSLVSNSNRNPFKIYLKRVLFSDILKSIDLSDSFGFFKKTTLF